MIEEYRLIIRQLQSSEHECVIRWVVICRLSAEAVSFQNVTQTCHGQTIKSSLYLNLSNQETLISMPISLRI